MKLCDGSLAGLIEEVNHQPVLPRFDIASQVASGLREMHKYGIIHCDIKKQNIFYDVLPGNKLHVYITDFGVSQILIGAEKVNSRVNVRIKALSIPYASPQVLTSWFTTSREEAKLLTPVQLESSAQAHSGLEAHPSRDVYALAILMYECCTALAHGTTSRSSKFINK